jgi:ribosomal protein L29|tara:strand:+ start:245 stop:442 length:198 start_codon:yes stop_codon:yes gene_type:complete
MDMQEIKKLDTEEIENKIKELKDSIFKNKIAKLNQGDFDTNSFIKIRKDIARCMTELNIRKREDN